MTGWIFSMIVVQKHGKIQNFLHLKDLNKALKRDRYPIPTVKDLFPQLATPKVLSKLDAKDGM